MIITREYINEHKTEKGAWTKSQILALGVEWPPEKGWQREVEGFDISDENRKIFESKIPAKKKKKKTAYSSAQSMLSKLPELTDDELERISFFINREISIRASKKLKRTDYGVRY